jgi:DNA-binding NarL/FixJ family response regulator
VEVTRQIKAHHLATEVLIFTMHDSDAMICEAFEAGARAFLLKSDARRFLLAAVDSLITYRPFFSGVLYEKMLERFLSTQKIHTVSSLSPREKNVVQLIAEGHSNKAMGALLNLSIKTIETRRASAMRKLDITSTAGIVRYAIRSKLIEP